LKERAKELKATLFLDAVAGEMTGKTLECLPSRSTLLFYGALSEKPISEIDPLLLIGRSYTIQGFILGEYV
jgi:NADPH:quinone reductase